MLVEVGMTGREVVNRIGQPVKVFPVIQVRDSTDQTFQVWAYSIKVPPDFGDAAEFVLDAGALAVLIVASKGNDITDVAKLGPRSKGYCTFWVGFGADGKVRGVSTVESTK